MTKTATAAVAIFVGLTGCSESSPPPGGPLGPLPVDPQAAQRLRNEADMRVLRATKPSDADFRARADFIKSQISSSEMILEQVWDSPTIDGGKPVCRVNIRGRLKMPTDYGPRGATCSCVVMLEWQDPDANAKPRNLGGAATMARYGGGGEGTYEAVIRMPRWEPGRYMAVLRINQREVDRKEFEIVPPS